MLHSREALLEPRQQRAVEAALESFGDERAARREMREREISGGISERTGAAGAPKYSDAGAWGPRIGQGDAKLLEHALKGFNAMPAQGGGDFSDLEVHRAMVYMVNNAGGKFAEPAAPAASASADAASAP